MEKRTAAWWPWNRSGRRARNRPAAERSAAETRAPEAQALSASEVSHEVPTTPPEVSRWATVRGLGLHYRVVGPVDCPAQGPPVVLLHGLMGHAREWDPAVRELAHGHQVWVLDQRGHGLSDWADEYSRAAMAEDLIAWCEHLGLGGAVVVGHSMGAIAALLAAQRRPDLFGRLVVVDAAPKPMGGDLAGYLREVLADLGGASYATVEEALRDRSGGPRARPALVRHTVEEGLVRGDDGRLRWRFDGRGLAGSLDSVGEAELWAAVEAVPCPVLLLRGEHSLELSAGLAEEMVRRFPDARLATIPDAGHDLGVEQPERVARAVLDFLADDRA
jgi:esterase